MDISLPSPVIAACVTAWRGLLCPLVALAQHFERLVCWVPVLLLLRLTDLESPLLEVGGPCASSLPSARCFSLKVSVQAWGDQHRVPQHQPWSRKRAASVGEVMAWVRFEAKTQNLSLWDSVLACELWCNSLQSKRRSIYLPAVRGSCRVFRLA